MFGDEVLGKVAIDLFLGETGIPLSFVNDAVDQPVGEFPDKGIRAIQAALSGRQSAPEIEGRLMVDQDQETLIKLRGKKYKSYLEKFLPSVNFASQFVGNFTTNVTSFMARERGWFGRRSEKDASVDDRRKRWCVCRQG